MEKGILLKENMKKQKPRLSGGECLQKKMPPNRVTSPPIYSARGDSLILLKLPKDKYI